MIKRREFLQWSAAAAAAMLARLAPPPGRMQAVADGQGEPLVVTVFARTLPPPPPGDR